MLERIKVIYACVGHLHVNVRRYFIVEYLFHSVCMSNISTILSSRIRGQYYLFLLGKLYLLKEKIVVSYSQSLRHGHAQVRN
jgi:hypothetical protein